MASKITVEQRITLFAQAIVEGKTQSDAYRLAYPQCLKWKPESIHNKASEYVRRDEVVARINLLNQQAAKAFEFNLPEIVESLYHIATNDPAEMYDEKGFVKPIHEIPKHVRQTLKGIKHTVVNKINKVETENGVVELAEPTMVIEQFQHESRVHALDKLLEFKVAELEKPVPEQEDDTEVDKVQLARQLLSLAYEAIEGKGK